MLTPSWPAAQSGWLLGMIEALRDDVVCLMSYGSLPAHTPSLPFPCCPLGTPRTRMDRLRSRLGRPTHNTVNYRLRRMISHKDVTCILCHYGCLATQFREILERSRVPVYIHMHGYDALFDVRHDDDASKRYHPAGYREDLLALSRTATLLVNSEYLAQILRAEGVPGDHIIVKHMGVNVPREPRCHAPRNILRIVSVGNFVDCKSHDRTLAAFEKVREAGVHAELTILGGGPLRAMCELLRMRSPWRDAIRLPGAVPVEQVHAALAASDIYTQHNIAGEVTRQVEALGVAVLEAMAAGLPVVGTRSGGVCETVVDGETGILVEPGDVDGQARAVIRLADDATLRQTMGTRGRERVAAHFSLSAQRQRLRAILGGVAGARR